MGKTPEEESLFYERKAREVFFNKVIGLQLSKKRLQHRCFPVNIAKFLKTALFIEHLFLTAPLDDCF